VLIGVKTSGLSQKFRMSELGPDLCIRSCHAKLGCTSYSYAGGETRRDLASGSREALAEGLSLLSVLADPQV